MSGQFFSILLESDCGHRGASSLCHDFENPIATYVDLFLSLQHDTAGQEDHRRKGCRTRPLYPKSHWFFLRSSQQNARNRQGMSSPATICYILVLPAPSTRV